MMTRPIRLEKINEHDAHRRIIFNTTPEASPVFLSRHLCLPVVLRLVQWLIYITPYVPGS